MRRLNCELHEAPSLLKREVSGLFPDRDVISKNLSVITLSQRTTNDMTGWSNDVEQEREAMIEQFVSAAKELCGRLKNEGYWSDFIDPSSGKPYYGQYTNTTMFETDEKYRLLGFRIEDLGCCKVISHREFGRNVFVGTIFTDSHPSSGVVQVFLLAYVINNIAIICTQIFRYKYPVPKLYHFAYIFLEIPCRFKLCIYI